MAGRTSHTGVLVEEDSRDYVRFGKLIAKAWAEGRIDGKYRCPVCGMRFRIEADSITCCAPAACGIQERGATV